MNIDNIYNDNKNNGTDKFNGKGKYIGNEKTNY